MKIERDTAADRDRAWDALAAVEDHPRVREWLEPSLARPTPRPLRWAAAAAVLLLAGSGAIFAYLELDAPRYVTAVSEQRDVLLADGSRVTLNTSTALKVQYDESARRIELERGEAIFSVKHDPSRPFEVVAGQTVARALGTEFNVDVRHDRIRVSVIEGVVRVSVAQSAEAANDATAASPAALALTKGRTAEFRETDQLLVEEPADLRRIQAWRARRLEFTDAPLSEALEEFNRYSTTHVVIGTPDLNHVRVSGVFRIGDTEGFLFSLREALGVRTLATADKIVLVRPTD